MKHINNDKVQQLAIAGIQKAVKGKLSKNAALSGERMAAAMQLIEADWIEYHNEVKAMHLDIDDIIQVLPEGFWDKLSENKKKLFEAAVFNASKLINRELEKFGDTIRSMAEHMDQMTGKQEIRKQNMQRGIVNKVYKKAS
jgi:hypothetical protein